MKKLLLFPTIIVTVLLAVAFILPATASGFARAVAPAVHAVIPSGVSAAFSPQSSARGGAGASVGSANRASQPAQANGFASTVALGSTSPNKASSANNGEDVHSSATFGRENCGRFGGGYHGGKHNAACPNKRFPPPASS